MLELQTQDSYCAGSQAQWLSGILCIRHRRVWAIEWRQLIPKPYGIYDEATFHMSGRVRHHNFRIWDSEKSHVLLTRPDPVCLRAPPVFMNFVCHSRIDGVLEGNGKLSEFFTVSKKNWVTLCGSIRTCIYSNIWKFLYSESTVTNTISMYKEIEIRLQIRVILANIYCSVYFLALS